MAVEDVVKYLRSGKSGRHHAPGHAAEHRADPEHSACGSRPVHLPKRLSRACRLASAIAGLAGLTDPNTDAEQVATTEKGDELVWSPVPQT